MSKGAMIKQDNSSLTQSAATFFNNQKTEPGAYTNHTLVGEGFRASRTTFDFMPWIWLIGICFVVYVVGVPVVYLIGLLVIAYLLYTYLNSK